MKGKFLAAALVLMSTAAASAQVDLNELRVYINPGHGSWTGNDRPMQVIGKPAYTSEGTDTTGFFESNTDLIKGFGVLEKLIQLGMPFDRTLNQTGERWEIGAARDLSQNIVMSRVKNGPYSSSNTGSSANADKYNRSLYEICCEVDQNEFDVFMSIHSNAASVFSVNYYSILYRGHNGSENAAVEGSYEIAEAATKFAFANEHACWTVSTPYIYGDVDFYKGGSTNGLGYYGYLGVLKHGTPGYLVEGFFHTYMPSTHRAMNFDVDIIEGYQYARGVEEYFEFENRDKTGEIYGIVRDGHVTFADKLYAAIPGSEDELKPVNGCKVYLWKGETKVAEYTTDEFYNGAFVFRGLEPGMYSLTFEHPEYLESAPVEVEVKADATVYPKCYLTDIYYNGRPGEELNYPNPVPAGTALQSDYDLRGDYVDTPIAQLEGATPERLIWVKNHLYVLGHDAEGNAKIVVLDANNGQALTEVSTDGCEGGIASVGDIQVTGDGTLVAVSKSKNQYDDKYVDAGETRGEVTFYRWEKDENGLPSGNPVAWFTTQTAGAWYRAYAGDTFAYRGTVDEGEIVMSCVSTASSAAIRNALFNVVDGVITEGEVSRPSQLAAKKMGTDFQYVVTPADRHRFYVLDNGTDYGIREYEFNHALNGVALTESSKDISRNTLGAGFFKWGDYVLMTMATPGDAAPLHLYNISRGTGAPEEITLTGIDVAGEPVNTLTTGFPTVYTDEAGNVTEAHFSLVLLRDNKISRFTTDPRSGIYNVTVDNVDNNAPVEFYDLSGRRVNGDVTPGIYIRRQGNEVSKIVVR